MNKRHDLNKKPDTDMDETLLAQEEVRRRLGGIGRSKLWELDRDGLLRGVSIGRRRVYPASEVRRFIASLKEQEAL